MIHRSSHPDVVVPDVSLTDHVLGRAREHGDRTALVDGTTGERLSYRALADAVDAGAAGLADLGVGPGAVVAVLSENQPRYAVAVHAVLRTGAAVTPMNPVQTGDELAAQLATSGARVVLSSAAAAGKAAAVARATGVVHHLVIDGEGTAEIPTLASLGGSAGPPVPTLDPATAPAVVPFSSGTTGLPKGVVLTHRNLVANLEQNGAGWRLTADDVLPAALPFFHIYGFTIILNAGLRAGATVVTLPRYSLRDFLRIIQEYGVTRAFLAPPMVLSLATAPEVDEYDLSSLRLGICGAAPLDVHVAERAERRVGVLIRQGYGMTEAAPGTHLVPDDEFAATPAGAVGRLVPNTEARLVDPETGTDADGGEPGELWVRGPQVMAGYLDDPEATAATLVDGGWLRTGDIVRVDDDGVFRVVDRLKELIKYKGYQVAPAELEAVLLSHPDVLDAAVVGVPDAEAGEVPKAVVVVARPVDPAGLMRWVAERVAPYKKVREVQFVDGIPRSPSGKILRRLLRR